MKNEILTQTQSQSRRLTLQIVKCNMRIWLVISLLSMFACFCETFEACGATAETDDGSTDAKVSAGLKLEVTPGFGGFFRVGYWTPLQVTIENKSANFAGTLDITLSQGSRLIPEPSTTIYRRSVYLPEYSKMSYSVNVHLGDAPRPIKLSLRNSSGQTVCEDVKSIRTAMTLAPLTLVVGASSGYEQLVGSGPGIVSPKVAYMTPSELPSAWLALSGVSMIVFHNMSSMEIDASQLGAIVQWVDTGGRLVVADGTGSRPSLALARSLLPVFISGSITAMSKTTIPGIALPPDIRISQNTRKTSAISPWRTIDTPSLGSMWKYGRGSVTYLPWNPLGRAFGSWSQQPKLWKSLISPVDLNAASPSGNDADEQSILAGISPGIGASYSSKWSVLTFLSVFVGGLWLLVKSLSSRGSSTQLFWPIMAITSFIFTLIGFYALGLPGLRRNTGISEINLILGRPECRYAQVASYINGFSPQSGDFKMVYRSDVQGLLLRQREGERMPDSLQYIEDSYSTMSITLNKWSGFDLTSTSVTPVPIQVQVVRQPKRSKYNRTNRVYRVTNTSSQPITDARAVFEETIIDLGDVQPYQTRRIIVPGRTSATEMVPVLDSVPLSKGKSLSSEEHTNRIKALEAVTEIYQTTGPALVGWLRQPVLGFVKYGGLRIRTSVGLVLIPLDAKSVDSEGVDAEVIEGEESIF